MPQNQNESDAARKVNQQGDPNRKTIPQAQQENEESSQQSDFDEGAQADNESYPSQDRSNSGGQSGKPRQQSEKNRT